LEIQRSEQPEYVATALLHIEQNVAEKWPFYIEDHHYRVHHVLLEPGELILFEGARLPHGRPKALQGSSYSDVIVHFRLTTRE
jgi:prolyl 4-hydroxylase